MKRGADVSGAGVFSNGFLPAHRVNTSHLSACDDSVPVRAVKFAQSLLLLVIATTSLSGCAMWGNRRDGPRHGNRKFQDTLVTRRAEYGPHYHQHEGYWTRSLWSEEWTDRGRPKEERDARQASRNRVWATPRTPMP